MKKRNLFCMRLLLLSMLCLSASTVMAEDMVLQVWLADGQVMSINLNEEPRTTYNDGNHGIPPTKTTVPDPS